MSDDDLISASKEGVAVVLLEGAGEPGCCWRHGARASEQGRGVVLSLRACSGPCKA